jgi:hypothetical protein
MQHLIRFLTAHTRWIRRRVAPPHINSYKPQRTITTIPRPIIPLILTLATTGSAAAITRVDGGRITIAEDLIIETRRGSVDVAAEI